ncbi:MAG: glycosyltransferase family 39 protein [Pseudomonadota bacterium]
MSIAQSQVNQLVGFLEKYGLLLVLTLYLIFQFFHLGHRWVDDESWYLMPLPMIFEEGSFRIPTVPGDDVFWPQPPLLTYLEAGFSKVVPLTSYSARLIPLTFGVLLLIGTYTLCRREFGWLVAVIGTFFVAADNILFLTARTVRPDIMVAAFQVFAIMGFLRYREGQEGRLGWLSFSALMAGLAVCSHPNGLLVPLSLLICTFLLVTHWPERIRCALIWGTALALSLLPFAIWMLVLDYENEFQNVISHWTGRHGRFADTPESGGLIAQAGALISAEFRGRYSDFIQWPYRIHIGVAALLGILASLFSKNRVVMTISVIAIAHLLFYIFVNNSNNSIRYLASMTPLLAILYAYWIAGLFGTGAPLKAIAGLLLIVVIGGSQFGGNMLYHWKYRQADYTAVVDELRRQIPPGSTVYGGMSFWLGLQEYGFVPYMRTDWDQAMQRYRPTHVIMDDWVMMGGWEDGEWRPLRTRLTQYLEQHGELVTKVANPFYGDLKLYRVSYPE